MGELLPLLRARTKAADAHASKPDPMTSDVSVEVEVASNLIGE